MHKRGREAMLIDLKRICKRRVYVTVNHSRTRRYVAVPLDERRYNVILPLRMKERRIPGQRFLRIINGWQSFKLHFDHVQSRLRYFQGPGRNGGDWLSYEAHAVGCENGLIFYGVAEAGRRN